MDQLREALLPLTQLDRDILRASIDHARTISPTWFQVCECLDRALPILYEGNPTPWPALVASDALPDDTIVVVGGTPSDPSVAVVSNIGRNGNRKWKCTGCKHTQMRKSKPKECAVCGGTDFE